MPGSWLNHDSRPLSDQWHELQRRGAVGLVPITQENIFRMRQEVNEIEARQAPRDEVLLAAKKEFTAVVHTYRRIWNEITEAQKQLGRHRMDRVYNLIFDMRDVLEPVTPPQDVLDAEYGGHRKGHEDLYRLRLPEFASVPEYSRALSRMNDLVFALTAKQAAVATVSRWPNDHPDAKANSCLLCWRASKRPSAPTAKSTTCSASVSLASKRRQSELQNTQNIFAALNKKPLSNGVNLNEKYKKCRTSRLGIGIL